MELSSNMTYAIFGPRNHSMHWRTREALEKRGLYRGHRPTDLCREFVKNHRIIEYRTNRLKGSYPDLEFIEHDGRLLELLVLGGETVDVYVYSGNDPLLVKNGNGRNPLAVLHPYYLWQIEKDRTAGKFLQYRSIVSHKGSYSYEFKNVYGS